eukprot:TRINITY_DN8146_c0_g1_i1.p1 TRINITY_DN8146_c0_g1~~TRINITY_DN8146_c0_g1_i1.p1  ORF type:complete len:222 (-),score=74.37 TRINITY_DN8146_c0_g1_i1:42-707(-)
MGMSMGGMIAQKLAFTLHKKKSLASLFLIVTNEESKPGSLLESSIRTMFYYLPFSVKKNIAESTKAKTREESIGRVLDQGFTPEYLNSPATPEDIALLDEEDKPAAEEQFTKRQVWSKRFLKGDYIDASSDNISSSLCAVLSHSMKPADLNEIGRSGIPITQVCCSRDLVISYDIQSKTAQDLFADTFVLNAGHLGVFQQVGRFKFAVATHFAKLNLKADE